MVKLLVIKIGNIATSLVLELLLDERADRKDIEVDVATTGAKMTPGDAERVLARVNLDEYNLIIYISPNPAIAGPEMIINALKGRNAIIIGDAPGVKIIKKLEEAQLGYLFILGDSMIGARREFLDATEMAIFNAEMLKVLSITGALRLVQEEIDKAVDALNKGEKYLPKLVVDTAEAVEAAGFENPYAKAKAMAAYEAIKLIGKLNVKGCFMVKDAGEYIPLVTSAHELLRMAGIYSDEAREMEKTMDTLLRKPHSRSGELLKKRSLMEKPS